MPQLDIETFPSQLFWLAVTFIVLYFLMSWIGLPRVTAAIDARRQRREDDLARAAELREDRRTVARTVSTPGPSDVAGVGVKGRDRALVLKSEADGVKPSIQAIFTKWINLEPIRDFFWCGYRLAIQVYREPISYGVDHFRQQHEHFLRFQDHWEDPILKTVVIENVGKTWSDQTTESLI